MTLEELILYYDGIGYRKSCMSRHRGSNGDGYINVGYFYNLYLKPYNYNDLTAQEFPSNRLLNKDDISANDWVGKPNGNKLLKLIHS